MPKPDLAQPSQLYRYDRLLVVVHENREQMGQAAARDTAAKIRELLGKQDFVNMIFAAAPSQNEFLEALITAGDIDWRRVNAFHMDEYIGLPEKDTRLFASFLREKIFSRLPFHTINYINGNAADSQAECLRYAQLLQQYPPDIVCMGIGENGHLAFNDPPVADFKDAEAVKIVKLDDICRQQQVNDGCFRTIGEVPVSAITLTIPALLSGKYVFCMVPGEKKAQAVYNTLHQEIMEACPSTILRRHPNAVLYLDNNSSALL